MYFTCKKSWSSDCTSWLLLLKQLRKNPRIVLVFEVGCLLLTGSDFSAKVKCGQQMIEPQKRKSQCSLSKIPAENP